jgi:hypothetical protein
MARTFVSGEKRLRDPLTGGYWVPKPKRAGGYVVKLISHGARVHLGIPQALAARMKLHAGALVYVDICAGALVIERMRIVLSEDGGGEQCTTTKSS